MPSVSRETSRESHSRHQYSISESGRHSTVPMWDSSDPERAPPPLPLNPGKDAGNTSPVKANASETVAAAARALVERARESMHGSYTTNASPERSPDRALMRTPQHKRLKSLQSTSMRDLRATVETPPELSSRASTPTLVKEYFPPTSPDSIRSRSATPTASHKEFRGRSMIEGTPPSATVLALQTMQLKDSDLALSDVTNGAITPRPYQNGEYLQSQIQNITAIANHLQQEMAALSRRSKDNATDLVSLKEATNMRDEDIRKSLRELVNNVRDRDTLLSPPRTDAPRASSAMSHAHICGSPTIAKCIQFSQDDADHERGRAPVLHSLDGTASMTMLEKIIRDMATKDSHEKLSTSLSTILKQSADLSSETTKKIEDLVERLREKEETLALVKLKSNRRRSSASQSSTSEDEQETRNLVLHSTGNVNVEPTPIPTAQPAGFVSDELRQMLQRIKDGIAQSGGMTSEVKSLVRELRGEVLGMGRELGRKVEQQNRAQGQQVVPFEKDKLEKLIRDGLSELKEQMEYVMHSHRRESAGSAMSRNTIDSLEVAEAVKHALAQYDINVGQPQDLKPEQASLDREAILAAVREAYEEYKPEIELQQFGLERDEILQCLREGLDDYQTGKAVEQPSGISREEILETIHGAVQQFQPPPRPNDAAEIKEEVLAAVSESLERFAAQSGIDGGRNRHPDDLTRGDVFDAVRDGLSEHKKSGAREIEISSEDLFEAVRSGLESTHVPYGQQVIESLKEIIDGMKVEFQQYSAANGRDTEQVLDAVKDGLESLRAEIELYVDRAQDVTGKDEIIDTLKFGFSNLEDNFNNALETRLESQGAAPGHDQLLSYIKAEFESIHDVVGANLASSDVGAEHKEDIIRAIVAGFAEMNASGNNRSLDEPSDELLDAFKAEFEQLQSNVIDSSVSHKDEIVESLQDGLESLYTRLIAAGGSTDKSESLEMLREDIQAMRDSLQAPVLHSGNANSSREDELVDTIRQTMGEIRVQMSSDQNEASRESLGHIREELENLRAAIGGSLMLSSGGPDKEEIADTVRRTLEDLQNTLKREELDVIRDEISSLRESLTNSLVPTGNSATSEELDSLHQTMESLRVDIGKIAEKPVDMTVSYEILDTLKSGLDNLRSDLDQLRSRSEDQMVLADPAAASSTTESDSLSKVDIERLEVMLAQLQIKVEAMDQNMQNAASAQPEVHNQATKDDIASVESILRDLQSAIGDSNNREISVHERTVNKDDTDALETLLQNTKAKIDEHVLPTLDTLAKQYQIETLEAFVKLTQENVDSVLSKLDTNSASKDDMAAIAHMVDEATNSVNELKERLAEVNTGTAVSKADVDLVGVMCMEIKNKLNDLSEDGAMPNKSEIADLGALLADFRESHDKLRERYEGDILVTAKAFDDRKEESMQIMERIDILRSSLEDANEEMRQRIKKSSSDVRAIDEILSGMEDKIDASAAPIQDLSTMFQAEIEKAQASLDLIRSEQGDQASSILDKNEEARVAMVAELGAKLEERFKEVLDRYDQQQKSAEEAAKSISDRAEQQEGLIADSRAISEDLKVSIDTLGATVTGIEPALKEATDRMSDDAKTVFSKVDDVQARMDEHQLDNKSEHQSTRNEVLKSLGSLVELRAEVAGQHPEFMGALKALLVIAEQHFELSRNFKESMDGSSDNIKAHFSEEIKRLPVPQIEGPPPAETVEDVSVHTKLDEMLSREFAPAYDDSKLHGKLDDILSRDSSDLKKTMEDLVSHVKAGEAAEKLDAMHAQVLSTATEVQGLVAMQTRLLEARQETKDEEARQAEMALNKALSEKEAVQAEILALKQTKESLSNDVRSLKAQHEQALTERMKLSAEVSSLETALLIRREELHEMDARADALERRIIDGVMDHSRALLLTKSGPKSVNMNLKRVTSNQSTTSAATATPTMVNSYVNMTLGKPNHNVYRSKTTASPSSRRIASLNQIPNSGAATKGLTPMPKAVTGGLSNLKRSQSVRNQALRKSSWAPGSGNLGGFDKENDVVSEESEAEQEAEAEYEAHRSVSQVESRLDGFSRRTSLTNSSQYTYGTGSEYTYGTGSMLSGSEADRRSSAGSTIRSSVKPSSSLEPVFDEQYEGEEHSEDDYESDCDASAHSQSHVSTNNGDEAQALVLANGRFKLPRTHTDGYDSGLGSDLPTAVGMSDLDGTGRDYFDTIKEE